MKKAFYRLKKFYILVFVLMLLFIILIKLLYSPLYLIYWIENDYAQEEQKLTEYQAYIKNPFEYINKFKPKLEDFKALNEKMKRVVFDFKIAKFFGFEDRYYAAASGSYSKEFIVLTMKEELYFRYLNFASDINSNSYKTQQYFNLKASTENLEKEIFNEKLEFIKHFEEFYNYLEDTGYLNQGAWYKGTANMTRLNIIYFLLNTNKNKLCLFKDRKLLFEKMKQSYDIFSHLDINTPSKLPKGMTYERWKNIHNEFLKINKNSLNEIQEALDECE